MFCSLLIPNLSRLRKIQAKFHEEITWENAYEIQQGEEEKLSKLDGSAQDAFSLGKNAYLDSLGPDGYALLKVM